MSGEDLGVSNHRYSVHGLQPISTGVGSEPAEPRGGWGAGVRRLTTLTRLRSVIKQRLLTAVHPAQTERGHEPRLSEGVSRKWRGSGISQVRRLPTPEDRR
ncbi:hypothetical protein BaRGS_00025720 [Batillaria attramentaria]|uniref:Uncharacterized protein n=1 Tax=Batillaria attramentaria TaxID=370345 RepID=A0ABD0K7C7_9CAEN